MTMVLKGIIRQNDAHAVGKSGSRASGNRQVRMAELMKMNLDAKEITTISMKGGEPISSLNQ